MGKAEIKREGRIRRHKRVRKHVSGNPDRPRLSVFRSNAAIYAQIIDDTTGRTVVSASSIEKEARGKGDGGNVAGAKQVGTLLAQRAKAAKVSKVVFDRGGNLYHGRVKALADAAREGGLEL